MTWQLPEPSRVQGVASGFAVFLAGFIAGITPAPAMHVDDWAATSRVVSAESGSPFPGKWNPDLVPYLVEPQQVLSPSDPSREVVVVKSAQTGFSECGLNMLGASVELDPCPMLVVLPTVDEAKRYNRFKLQPMIDACPSLRRAIFAVKSRDEESSTTLTKQFRRGYILLTGANSSVGLQMVSARKIIYEEVSGYPDDAGGRGDPIEQAEARGKAWLKSKPKRYKLSTPGIKGACRITAAFEESDQRRRYVPCPSCGHYQVLRFANLKWRSPVRPHGAFFVCAANGCVIDAHQIYGMDARGAWIKTYAPADGEAETNPPPPETFPPDALGHWRARLSGARQPGFHIWQAYAARFSPLDEIVAEWLGAQGKPERLKAFMQQTLGEAWEETGEAPPAERLLETREAFAWRRVPDGALFLTGMVDVQADRLEFGVYAWSRSLFHGWMIDGGVIEGDPGTDLPWATLDQILARTYEDGRGNAWDIDALGVDAGYLSNRVYNWVRRHSLPRYASEPHLPPTTRHTFALDGRAGWRLPAIGTPKTVDIDFDGQKVGSCRLWPTGTFDLKSETYTALRNVLKGPDGEGTYTLPLLHYNMNCDRAFFDQLTAEHVADVKKRSGVTTKEWVNPQRKRNEALDIVVGARALAHHLSDALTEADWAALAARRAHRPVSVQGAFDQLWEPDIAGGPPPEPSPGQAPSPPPAPADSASAAPAPTPANEPAGDSWLGDRVGADWLKGRGR